ncbi:MAG: DsrE family protein [Acetobacteraceae bacterium]
MTGFARRGLMTGLVAATALAQRDALGAPPMLKLPDLKKETEVACLYHCDFGDARRFSQMLDNIRNHLEAYDFDTLSLKIVIVVHSAGIRFFLSDQAGTQWEKDPVPADFIGRMSALGGYGVQALLCAVTFKKNGLSQDRARSDPWIRMVPSGVATVGALQAKGFGYLKVG